MRVILVRSVYAGLYWCGPPPPISSDKSQSPLPGTEGYLPQRKMCALLSGRGGEGRELFLHLLFLSDLQLKRTLMSKWHILGWSMLIPFRTISTSSWGEAEQGLAQKDEFRQFL